eukprot:scaffold30584_cov47-Phaeocystis_antarctica.AAC.1
MDTPWRGTSSGWCVRCSPHSCLSVVRGPSHWRRESRGPPFSRLSLPGVSANTNDCLYPSGDLSHGLPPTHPSRSRRPSPEQRPARCWPAGAPARDRALAAG